jgi:hypothetical protein
MGKFVVKISDGHSELEVTYDTEIEFKRGLALISNCIAKMGLEKTVRLAQQSIAHHRN